MHTRQELHAPLDGIIIVGWEEPEDADPENPQNWPSMVKWANILTISVISFLVRVSPCLLGQGWHVADLPPQAPGFVHARPGRSTSHARLRHHIAVVCNVLRLNLRAGLCLWTVGPAAIERDVRPRRHLQQHQCAVPRVHHALCRLKERGHVPGVPLPLGVCGCGHHHDRIRDHRRSHAQGAERPGAVGLVRGHHSWPDCWSHYWRLCDRGFWMAVHVLGHLSCGESQTVHFSKPTS